jgi:hypothetical protein
MAQRPDVDDVRILRINHDPADLARLLQADVRPGRAAIRGFVDAVAGREIGTNVGLAGSGVNGFGVGGRYGDRADRSDGLTVKNRGPDSSGIGGFLDAPIDRAKVKRSGVARHAGHGGYPATTEWPNEAPLEPIHQFRRN